MFLHVEHVENRSLIRLKSEPLHAGCNKIQDLRNIVYLRKLTGLSILTLVGNPIHANPSFQGLALAHLPHLKYLDNKALLKAEVEAARQRYQVCTAI